MRCLFIIRKLCHFVLQVKGFHFLKHQILKLSSNTANKVVPILEKVHQNNFSITIMHQKYILNDFIKYNFASQKNSNFPESGIAIIKQPLPVSFLRQSRSQHQHSFPKHLLSDIFNFTRKSPIKKLIHMQMSCKFFHIHKSRRITESQNGRGWKGPLWVIQSNPPAEAGSPTASSVAHLLKRQVVAKKCHSLP